MIVGRDQNIFDSKKRLKAATAEGLELKLTSAQRNIIARNQALLAMFTAQVDLCRQLVDQLDATIVPDRNLILAGVLAKSGSSDVMHKTGFYTKWSTHFSKNAEVKTLKIKIKSSDLDRDPDPDPVGSGFILVRGSGSRGIKSLIK